MQVTEFHQENEKIEQLWVRVCEAISRNLTRIDSRVATRLLYE